MPTSRPKASIYLESRYCKLERGLPQTIFYCPECKGHRRRRKTCERCEGYGKLTKDSVQELIGRHVLPAYRARTGKFHGAGREDVDVRMLGTGRPFVYEVVGARVHDVDLEKIRAEIHEAYGERIQLAPFVPVARPRVAFWKESKMDKVYRADVLVVGEVDAARLERARGVTRDIVQRTPPRVAHRRADLERERRVTIVGVDQRDTQHVDVEVRCSHGTYVKEWISGDEGRTQPSLADELGVACSCEALDVIEIVQQEVFAEGIEEGSA